MGMTFKSQDTLGSVTAAAGTPFTAILQGKPSLLTYMTLLRYISGATAHTSKNKERALARSFRLR